MTHSGEDRRYNFIIRGRSIDLAFWIKMILAVGILFIIPFEFTYYEAFQPEPTPNLYDIWIQTVVLYYVDWSDRGIPPVNISDPMTIAAAIVICIPAVLLNRRIRNQNPRESIREAGVAALFGTAVITIFLVDYFPPSDLLWLIQISPARNLGRFGAVVMIALIVFPILIREASHRGLQRSHRILALMLGLIAILMPAAITIRFLEGGVNYISVSSAYQLWYETSLPEFFIWQPASQINLSFWVFEAMDLLYHLVFSGLRLIFVVYLLRYIRGLTSKRNMFILGVASFLVPYVYFGYRGGLIGPQYPSAVIPLPLLLILGIIILVRVNPLIDPEGESVEELRESTIEYVEQQEKIIVPVAYIIRSKLRGVKKRIAKLRNRS